MQSKISAALQAVLTRHSVALAALLVLPALLEGCVAIPAVGAIGAIAAGTGTVAAVGGTVAAVGGTTAVVGGTAAAVGGTTAVVGGTAAAATAGAGTAAGTTASGVGGAATGYQPAASAARSTSASGSQASSGGTGSASQSGPGYQQSAGPGGARQSGPGFNQSAGPGGATQSGPGYSQSAGPGGATQSGPGYRQSAGPGGASQSGPGFSQSAGPGGARQSGPGFSQSAGAAGAAQAFPLAPTTGMIVAGAVIAAVAIVSHEILAVDLTPAGREEAQKLGLQTVESRKLKNLGLELTRLRAPDRLDVTQVLVALRGKDPAGAYDLNPVYRVASAGTACTGVRCYGRQAIAWPERPCKDEDAISLGMIDSALDPGQPAFEDANLHTRRFSNAAKPTAAESEHGTAVAAQLIGRRASDFPGLLPMAELYAADIFTLDAQGQLETDAARFVTALDWLFGKDVSVINISIAGPDSRLLHTAIQRTVARGIGVVAAAGNLGARGAPQYPAAYPEVIAVTAADRGGRLYTQASRGSYVALAAPGYEIWTAGANGTGAFRSGTSFAAPFVTGAYAEERHRAPDESPAAILQALRAHAQALKESGAGAGMVQALGCSRRDD